MPITYTEFKMAQKRKTTSQKRKTTSGAQPAKRNTPKGDIHRGWSIAVFGIGVIWLCLCLIPGQEVWENIRKVTFGVFGLTNYFIGAVLIYLAVIIAKNRPVKWKAFQAAVSIILTASLVHILATAFTDESVRVMTLKGLYESGKPFSFTGGAASFFISVPLINALGIFPALIVLAVLTAAFVMFLTDTTPYDLYKKGESQVEKQKQIISERAQNMPAKAQKPVQENVQPVQPETPKPRKSKKIDFAIDEPKNFKEPQMESLTDIENFSDTVQHVQEEKTVQQQKIDDIMKKLNLTPAETETKEEDKTFEQNKTETKEENKADLSEENKPSQEGENAHPAPEYVYKKPSINLFDKQVNKNQGDIENELKTNAQLLVDTLASFGVQTKIIDISRGPSVTRYELQPLAGVKISKITNLADDIALNLAASGVRIEAPIPNKAAVGIEVPNKVSSAVNIRSILESKEFKENQSPLAIALGKDIAGNNVVADLTKMPHLLIAGSTGSGKSVCVNAIITSFLYKSSPEDVKLILIDPKVVELTEYNGIPHLIMPVVTEPKKAAGALGSAVAEMERRYKMFAQTGVREIKSYNKLAQTNDELEKMPYVAIIIDELADLMMVAGKEVEDYICRIAQKARAAGMHLIVATQRPSVDVITGLIKANIPARIAFAVSSQIDSRTILDAGGAEKLLGMGDMLYLPLGANKPIRVQGTYVKDSEISKVTEFIKKDYTANYNEEMINSMEQIAAASSSKTESGGDDQRDEMVYKAIEVVVDVGQASTSLLQRKLKLGYARAARIMDEMEEMGIIGPYEGSKPRQVLITKNQWLEMMMRTEENKQ